MLTLRFAASSAALLATVVVPWQAMAQASERCFDLTTPGLVSALARRPGQLLVIQLRNAGPGAELAAATLAKAAAARGLRTELLPAPWPAQASDAQAQARAVKVSSDQHAELVAFVEELTGSNPLAVRLELRDHTGQKLAGLVSWSTEASNCPSAVPRSADAELAGGTTRPRPGDLRWYGGQLLLAEFGALGLMLVAPPASFVAYVLVPPALHANQGSVLRAGASLVLRVGLPLAGAAWFASRAKPSDEAFIDYGLGLLTGALVASIIDDLFLAWGRVPADACTAAPRPRRESRGPRLGVAMVPYGQGAALSLVGRF